MARHEAPDGAGSHPLVADALRRHPHGGVGAHRGELPGRRGPIGWPGPDRDDERIGWPGDLPGRPGPELSAPDDEDVADPERPAGGRSPAA